MAQTSPASERLDKVTIITGVAKASARAAPASSCAPGATVVICARDKTAGVAAAADIAGEGPGTCSFEQCDVTRPPRSRASSPHTVER